MTGRPQPPTAFRDLAAVPATRAGDGVFTVSDALTQGWTSGQVRHRIRCGAWVRLTATTLAGAGQHLTPGAAARAAALTMPDAMVSHASAARVHGFPVPAPTDPFPVQVIAGPARRSVRGIRVRLGVVDPRDRCTVAGAVLTGRGRTALDCLATLPPDAAWNLLAWVTTRRVLDRESLVQAIADRQGQHGTGQLLRLLTGSRGGAVSPAERRLHDLVRSAGLTGWEAGVRLEDAAGRVLAVVDLLFRSARLVVEVDGWQAHSGREAFDRDRRRQNALVHAGYLVLRFTWTDLQHRPDAVVAEIIAALDRRS